MPNPTTLPTRDDLIRLNPRLVQRFIAKVRLGNATDNECWVWRNDAHRPRVGVRLAEDGRLQTHYASRVAYVLNEGSLPAGAWVLHHCDRDGCVNPSHLHAGGAAMNAWGRRHAADARAFAPCIAGGPNVIPHERLWEGWELPADYMAVYAARLRDRREGESDIRRIMEEEDFHAA